MGSYCSCPDKDSIPDTHQSKFKVINVDDDGNELGAGLMELTEEELVLHTRKRDAVTWPYLCLRRYGYDSNLFSFESGRRCQTGQGIFAFKCARAEEIFNMLQDVMHSNSISVVEETVMEANPTGSTEVELPCTPCSPTTPGCSVPALANGIGRCPSFGEAWSRPSSRHPSVGSARLPSVGEESTHPLLVADNTVHTYVNTADVQDDRRTRPGSRAPSEVRLPKPDTTAAATPPSPAATDTDTEPQVLLEPDGVQFILGPTPAQRRRKQTPGGGDPGFRGPVELGGSGSNGEPSPAVPPGGQSGDGCLVDDTVSLQAGDCDNGYDSDGRKDAPPPTNPNPHPGPPPYPANELSSISTPEPHNGATQSQRSTPVPISAPTPRRNRPTVPLPDSSHNVNNSAQRRTALLNYENLPPLPPVWETARRFSEGDEEDEEEVYHGYRPKTPSLNGYHNHHNHHHRPHLHRHSLGGLGLDPMHNYVNTENVNIPLSAKLDSARLLPRGRDCTGRVVGSTPTIFNFDFRPGRVTGGLASDPLRQLNYIELEMEKGSDSSGPQTPKTPTTPSGVGLGGLLLPPSTPTRRTELYAMIDIERTAAMSSLQKALPRDDGTSRKTRHNSTDLPM
ncbi:fibroblast growth factor receptor substrate 2a [Esox lucius]|uniref:IRS-type PTB domain-containing protein n=2 Tax=Esox lucius TaxID=8010 RepID=A0AAY5L2D5_ESOLU|nr:fibroblast growth factor receptor substrate 2a [Esox lucius]XP_010890318.2 fibroblast growth factor receptor substrate 2a [Esox lucius]XP_034143870.1 fibroblast growth factor receptor substrate 2a [Esox lucius]